MGNTPGTSKTLLTLHKTLTATGFTPSYRTKKITGITLSTNWTNWNCPKKQKNILCMKEYGRDVAINDGGRFTERGYIYNNRNTFTEWYNGRENDIPREYKIMSFPQPERTDPEQSYMDAAAPEQKQPEAPAQEAAQAQPEEESVYKLRRNPYSDSRENSYILQEYVFTQGNPTAKMGDTLYIGTLEKCLELMGQLAAGELDTGTGKGALRKGTGSGTARTGRRRAGQRYLFHLSDKGR